MGNINTQKRYTEITAIPTAQELEKYKKTLRRKKQAQILSIIENYKYKTIIFNTHVLTSNSYKIILENLEKHDSCYIFSKVFSNDNALKVSKVSKEKFSKQHIKKVNNAIKYIRKNDTTRCLLEKIYINKYPITKNKRRQIIFILKSLTLNYEKAFVELGYKFNINDAMLEIVISLK